MIQDNALCAGFPGENDNLDSRARNASTASSKSRALLETNQGDLGTANYGYEEWSGTYYLGTATVIWGTWHATNMVTGEKWQDEGEGVPHTVALWHLRLEVHAPQAEKRVM